MEILHRKSFLLFLIERMQEADSWTGETHIQKSVYFLQKLLDVSLEYEYIFYKHGPFSFELRDELSELRADKFLDIKSKEPYGASFLPGEYADVLKNKYEDNINKFLNKISFVVSNISNKTVKDLEKLSTALYVYKEVGIKDEGKIINKIVELKPHISRNEAQEALDEFFNYLDEFDYELQTG